MTAKPLPSDEQLVGSYELTGSCHKTGAVYGLPGHLVYQRLRTLGVVEQNLALERELLRPAPVATIDPESEWIGRTLVNWFLLFKSDRALTIRQFCRKFKLPESKFVKLMAGAFPEEWRCLVASRFKKSGRYVRGRKIELEVRDDLLRRGYPFSYRSPLSRGPFDVLAIRLLSLDPRVLMVQVKAGMQITQDEATALWDAAIPCGAVAVLAGNPSGSGLVYNRLVSRETRLFVPFEP